MSKTAQDYLAEAHAIVSKIETDAGIARHGQANVVFVDVRDGMDIAKTGTLLVRFVSLAVLLNLPLIQIRNFTHLLCKRMQR